MQTKPWIERALAILKSQKIKLEDGLSDAEVTCAEDRFRFDFPPDLREFIQVALPVSGGFPNWRSESENTLSRLIERPTRELHFDVDHNGLWLPSWGTRPHDLVASVKEAHGRVRQAPALVPLRWKHYIAAYPHLEGNPIFAISQSDVSCIAVNLATYLCDGDQGDLVA